MADLLGLPVGDGLKMPSFNMSGIGTTIMWIAIVLIAIVIVAIFIWLHFQKKLYNKKVVIFENLGGNSYRKTGEDTARLIKIGDGGEEILFLRGRKTYRTAYGKKMGDNLYWFAIGQDGYWYNCTLGDLDAKMGMLDIEPVDRDMRYMHVAIRKNISDRYKPKVGFMDKWGGTIFNLIALGIILLGGWFIADKLAEGIGQLVTGLKDNQETIRLMKEALATVQSTCQGGAGFIKV